MTIQEKLRKAEQKNKRTKARLAAAERRNQYLLSLCERIEDGLKRETAAVRTQCELLTLILERVAIEVGEITIPTDRMKEAVMGYEVTFEAITDTHEIRIKAVKKEQA